jgi:hypothetical protein
VGSSNPTYYGAPWQKSCPGEGVGSAGFDWYFSSDDGSNPDKNCIAYAPNPTIGKGGYAYPDFVPIPPEMWAKAPDGQPSQVTACWVAAPFYQSLADKIAKGVSDNGGTPYQPVQPGEVRNGCIDAQVADLSEGPVLPAASSCSTTPGSSDPSSVAKPPGATGGSSTGGSGTITGDDPNITANDPTAPSNIMDPIFNWMPKLPQLTLNTGSAQCPTWNVDLTSFGGSSWHWTMDAQCALSESVRSALSALMVSVWGIAAAVVILRA